MADLGDVNLLGLARDGGLGLLCVFVIRELLKIRPILAALLERERMRAEQRAQLIQQRAWQAGHGHHGPDPASGRLPATLDDPDPAQPESWDEDVTDNLSHRPPLQSLPPHPNPMPPAPRKTPRPQFRKHQTPPGGVRVPRPGTHHDPDE